jgi:hypothetical protein
MNRGVEFGVESGVVLGVVLQLDKLLGGWGTERNEQTDGANERVLCIDERVLCIERCVMHREVQTKGCYAPS